MSQYETRHGSFITGKKMGIPDDILDFFYTEIPNDPIIRVVYHSNDLLIVNKPWGLVTHPTKGDEYSSLVSRVSLYLKKHNHSSPIHLINRLDRETSGLIVFALSDSFARLLRKQWELKEVQKGYLCIAHGSSDFCRFLCDGKIGNDEESPIYIKDCVREDGKESSTIFQTLKNFEVQGEQYTLIEAHPQTGRKHQIRIHLSHLGYPILGDKIYGLDQHIYLRFISRTLLSADKDILKVPYHALHAAKLTFNHPEIPFSSVECLPESGFLDFIP